MPAETFSTYVVKCQYGPMDVLTDNIQREEGNRIAKFGTPGNDGDYLQHLGKASIVDTVTALMTGAEIERFRRLIKEKKVRGWTHPLLGYYEAYIENFSIDANSETDGYFKVTFSAIQHSDPKVLVLSTTVLTPSANSKQAKSLWDDLSTKVEEKQPWDGTGGSTDANGEAFDDAWSDIEDAWDGLDSDFDGVESGDSTWNDLARAVDTFSDATDVFIDTVRDVEEFIGETARDIQTIPRLIVEAGHDAVEALREDVEDVATLKTLQPSDLPTMLLETTGTVDILETVMSSNNIDNPFFIMPGITITIPIQ